MSFTNYSPQSPYANTPQTSWYLDLLEFRDIPRFDSDREITVQSKYEFRPDILAFDLYGSTKLWWVFSVRNKNKIKDPVYDLVEGLKIIVTDRDQLFGILNG